MDFWWKALKAVVGTYLALFVEEIHISGRENIKPGPKIVVANHANVSDGFVIPFVFPERLYHFTQEESFTLPIFGRLLAKSEQIPVVIGQGREALRIAKERLIQGCTVVIYPEGRLNHGEEFRRGGAGAAILAVQTRAPIVPVGIYVPPEYVWKIKSKVHDRDSVGGWQYHGACYVKVGKPWLPVSSSSMDESYRSLRAITDNIMSQIIELVEKAKAEAHALRS